MAIGNFLTTVEVADILGVSRRRVLQFVDEKRLEPKGEAGSAWLFDSREVRQFSKEKRQTGRPKNNGKKSG